MSISSTHLLPVDWLQELAVFPLPRTVFFPGTTLPLHIFEERYRAMMQHCIRTKRMAIAVALLKPGYEASYEGRPPIYQVCGVGRIENHEELADGRFNLVLRGVARVHLTEVAKADLPFRLARAEVLDARHGSDRLPKDALTTLLSTASLVATVVRKQHADFSLGIAPDDPPHQIADTLADRLLADPEARQDVLETLDIPARIQKLTGHIASVLGQLETQLHAGRGTVQ